MGTLPPFCIVFNFFFFLRFLCSVEIRGYIMSLMNHETSTVCCKTLHIPSHCCCFYFIIHGGMLLSPCDIKVFEHEFISSGGQLTQYYQYLVHIFIRLILRKPHVTFWYILGNIKKSFYFQRSWRSSMSEVYLNNGKLKKASIADFCQPFSAEYVLLQPITILVTS